MKIFKLFFVAFSLFIVLAPLFSQSANYSIVGEVRFKGKGDIINVILVDEKAFSKNGEGLQIIRKKLSSEELSKGIFLFSFNELIPGEYGIKCFIDKNNNGKLDFGVFGPTEPWGMSWKDKKPFGKPKFSQMNFKLDKNMRIKIKVE